MATPVERADFDDLVTLVTQAPTWEKDRSAGIRVLLRAIGEGKPAAPDQILARWTWKLARTTRKVQDRRVSTEFPEAKRLLGAAANSRGYRHEENVNRLVQVAGAMPLPVGAALLASADGYTPRANAALDKAREELGTTDEIATALADNLPAPKLTARKSRRRRRKRRTRRRAIVSRPRSQRTATDPPSRSRSSPSRRTIPRSSNRPKMPRRQLATRGSTGLTAKASPRGMFAGRDDALADSARLAISPVRRFPARRLRSSRGPAGSG